MQVLSIWYFLNATLPLSLILQPFVHQLWCTLCRRFVRLQFLLVRPGVILYSEPPSITTLYTVEKYLQQFVNYNMLFPLSELFLTFIHFVTSGKFNTSSVNSLSIIFSRLPNKWSPCYQLALEKNYHQKFSASRIIYGLGFGQSAASPTTSTHHCSADCSERSTDQT